MPPADDEKGTEVPSPALGETAPAVVPVGAAPAAPGGLCPVCRTPAAPDAAFCARCGAALGAAVPEKDPLVGAVIDNRYRVLESLGQGGMGSVYLAEHVGIGKRVAVKVLRAHLRTQPELVRRFRREALALSKLTDAHTIAVFDFGIWEGVIYLAMEYLRGEDLGKLLAREQRLPPARALSIALQICSSLAEAHGAGLVHRDLKPENVFLQRTNTGEEWAKVLDFGLAKTVREGPERADLDPRGEAAFQTAHGALLGTPYFMAPEQVRGEPVDGRTDLYALGALVYRMISGEYPHTGKTPMQVLESHLSGLVRPLGETLPGLRLPDGCEALVRRMLAREPADRPADAAAVAAELTAISRRAALNESRAEAAAAWQSSTFQGKAPAAAPETDATSRDEVAAFERSLRQRARLRTGGMLLAAVALAGGLYQVFQAPAPALTAEVEPNDEPSVATPLTVGLPLRGHIGRRTRKDTSDRDVYVVSKLPDRCLAEADVTPVPGLDLVFEGFDREGRTLFKVNERGPGQGEHLAPTALTAEPLYLVVREVWVQGALPMENSTDPYTLTFRCGGR